MPSLNKLQLIGNLTRDPELRHTPKGTALTEISLAINRQWTNEQGQKQEEVTFVELTFWGRTAEVAAAHLSKGVPIFVEGRLTLDTWIDKDTGKNRSKLKVIGEQFQFLASKPATTERQQQAPPAHQSATSDHLDAPPDPDEDLPF